MTPAQHDAASRIVDTMREHFDAGVCVLVADEEQNDMMQGTEILWHGGYAHAVGLSIIGAFRILTKGSKHPDFPAQKPEPESESESP
jgi:hypothetical protein